MPLEAAAAHMRIPLTAATITMIALIAIGRPMAFAQPPGASGGAATPERSKQVQVQDPPTAGFDRNGPVLGIELQIGRGDRFGMLGVSGQVGWIVHSQLALFGTAALGGVGNVEAGFYAALGVGARLWVDRFFLDTRIERMSIALLECEEDCSPAKATLFSAGIGIDAIHQKQGGLQLYLKIVSIDHIFGHTLGALVGVGGNVYL
jgi:hypothetical protein